VRTPGEAGRVKLINNLFGNLPAAEIKPSDIEQKLSEIAGRREWTPATVNRHKAVLSLIYRLAVSNGKVSMNPARLVRRLPEGNHQIHS
jgi:hypothetical protein